MKLHRSIAFLGSLLAAAASLPAASADGSISAAERNRAPSLSGIGVAELEARVAQGDLRAQAELGARYGRGDGVPQDVEKAVRLLTEAAERNDPDALYWLGTAYTNGVGVPKNEAQAVLLYERAAAQGHAEAQYVLAVMISTGQGGISPNWAAAIPFFWKSADQGFPLAEFMMGYAYQQGQGVDRNPEIAAYWYRRTHARLPNQRARYNLGLMIARGQVARQPGDPEPAPVQAELTQPVSSAPVSSATENP